jgi:hypothetical protein
MSFFGGMLYHRLIAVILDYASSFVSPTLDYHNISKKFCVYHPLHLIAFKETR